ncbi:MAG: hypothetical protein ACOZE7_07145 [Pseudomonadota bacterium]
MTEVQLQQLFMFLAVVGAGLKAAFLYWLVRWIWRRTVQWVKGRFGAKPPN